MSRNAGWYSLVVCWISQQIVLNDAHTMELIAVFILRRAQEK
jgi:hypothetical protein